jgi:ribonuclease HI
MCASVHADAAATANPGPGCAVTALTHGKLERVLGDHLADVTLSRIGQMSATAALEASGKATSAKVSA